jgi:hypothetical protein
MLLTRQEMSFDFGGAKLELPRDRELLRFIFSQFLYGEITGIQCGHWLYHAPDLEAARFFARQSVEELTHVVHMRRVFDLLECEPSPPHRLVRFLSTGFIGGGFEEHVALEMAQGEGFVLMVFYALIDVVADPRIRRILEAAVVQEERHVSFGEERTLRAVAARPALARHLLGLNLISLLAMRQFATRVGARLADPHHPVVRQVPALLQRTSEVTELRLRRLGVLDRPLAELGAPHRAALMLRALASRAAARLSLARPRLLTDTYLDDPLLSSGRSAQYNDRQPSLADDTDSGMHAHAEG